MGPGAWPRNSHQPRRPMSDESPQSLSCPTPGELSAFATGNLARGAFERVARHVERCAACGRNLGALDNLPDPLLTRLREPDRGETTAEVLPPALLPALRALGTGSGGSPPPAARTGHRLGKFELLEELGAGS